MEIGFNLYSIRGLIRTPEGMKGAFGRLKDMGYTAVQFSGDGYDPALLQCAAETFGMKIVLTHMPLSRLLNDRDSLMAEHETFGCRNIGLGMMPADIAEDDTAVAELTERLETSAEYMRRRGFTLYYHNHSFEFRRMGDKTVYDYLLANTRALCFVPDTYWLQHGGVSVIGYIRRLSGRCGCAHLKDYKMCGWNPGYASVGDGNIDWTEVLPALTAAGTEHFIVEQDDAGDYPDPYKEAAKSITYLKNLAKRGLGT